MLVINWYLIIIDKKILDPEDSDDKDKLLIKYYDASEE